MKLELNRNTKMRRTGLKQDRKRNRIGTQEQHGNRRTRTETGRRMEKEQDRNKSKIGTKTR